MTSLRDQRSGFQLYNALIQPLRQMDRDQGNELLKRFLKGAQAQFESNEAMILSILDQVKPDLVRSDLVQYLKDIVGFTNETRAITDRLDEEHLRRLITLAVPLWRERFTGRGLVNAIRLFTGRTAFISTWFSYRNLLGEALINEDQLVSGGDNWIIGGETSLYDEYWSNIRIMDDGTLDEELLIDVLRLSRPFNERIEVMLEDFIDRFDTELDKWTFTEAGDPSTIEDGVLLLDCAGTTARPIIPLYDGTETGYNIVTKFWFEADDCILTTHFNISASNIYFSLEIAADSIYLLRYGPGFSVLGSSTAFPIVPECWYKLRVTSVLADDGTLEIKVYIDANLVMTANSTLPAGPWEFITAGNAGELVKLDNVESWRNPARFATIKLSTLDERGGAVTMTDNFIQ